MTLIKLKASLPLVPQMELVDYRYVGFDKIF